MVEELCVQQESDKWWEFGSGTFPWQAPCLEGCRVRHQLFTIRIANLDPPFFGGGGVFMEEKGRALLLVWQTDLPMFPKGEGRKSLMIQESSVIVTRV